MRLYLDYHATTPLDPRVLQAMLPFFTDDFGNPSSKTHPFGWRAQEAVEQARVQVARLVGASPKELIFTSGATESNNLALLGAAAAAPKSRNHIVTQATEHHAVLDTLKELERRGFRLTVLQPDAEGAVRMDALEASLSEATFLVSIMAANNEIGTLAPLAAIGALCRRVGALFHTDAAQAAGKVPLDVEAAGVDLLSLTAHKFCGPKGCGALYVRRRGRRVPLRPILFGGGQEEGLRPGTLNVPGVVGLGEASRLALAELASEAERVGALRERLLGALEQELLPFRVNGPSAASRRLPGNLSVSFPGVDGSALLLSVQDIGVSAGAACTAGSTEPSYVLKAIGLPAELAASTLRFGLGRFTTELEVDQAAATVVAAVGKLRRDARARAVAAYGVSD